MAVGMVRFDTGATLTFTVTFALNTAGPQPADVEGLVNPQWGEVIVYGKKGGIDVWAGKVAMGRKNKGVMVTPLKVQKKHPGAFALQAREFVRAVKAGDEPLNSSAQAIMLMQMLDALKKSGETRKSVRIQKIRGLE
jgi:predicted dehydrogenase